MNSCQRVCEICRTSPCKCKVQEERKVIEFRTVKVDNKYCWIARQGGKYFIRSVRDFPSANQANNSAKQAARSFRTAGMTTKVVYYQYKVLYDGRVTEPKKFAPALNVEETPYGFSIVKTKKA